MNSSGKDDVPRVSWARRLGRRCDSEPGATIVQTLVITLTPMVFIFQFLSKEKAIKEASYQNLLGRYNDFIMSGRNSDNLFFARLLSQDRVRLEAKDVANFRRLMISYGIMEEVYELYREGWIDEDAWEQWNAWLKALSKTPHFETLHSSTADMFDRESRPISRGC